MEHIIIIKLKEKWDKMTKKTIKYKRRFSSIERDIIQNFNGVEDSFSPRWGGIYQDSILYLFRTWTGSCIYEVHFSGLGDAVLAKVCDDKNIYDSFPDYLEKQCIDDIIDDMILNRQAHP